MAANMTDDLLNDDMDFMLAQVAENISFFFLLKLKILEESEQFFIWFLKKMENLRRFFSISEVWGGQFFWTWCDSNMITFLLQNW